MLPSFVVVVVLSLRGFVCASISQFQCLLFHQIPINTTCGIYPNGQRYPNAAVAMVISCIQEGSPSVDQLRVGVVEQEVK